MIYRSITFLCTSLFIVNILSHASFTSAKEAIYDPLSPGKPSTSKPIDLTINDTARSREIPIRVYLPATTSQAPLVLFSHGLGGSRENDAYFCQHWANHGYVVVAVQHHGSDSGVWINEPPENRMKALEKAMSVQNFLLRVKDIPAVLDQLEKWNKSAGDVSAAHALTGRIHLENTGMCGHSFGAVTTQAVSGQATSIKSLSFTDHRIKAALAMSPSVPTRGDAKTAFGAVKLPWMLMTGTKDCSPFGTSEPAARRGVYAALPATGNKYELVLENAEHSAFSDRALPGDKEKRNPNHHRIIIALSTAFWDTYLRNDLTAKAWLDGDGPKAVLEKGDLWERK